MTKEEAKDLILQLRAAGRLASTEENRKAFEDALSEVEKFAKEEDAGK
jgi:hypothetical protein